MKKYLTTYYPGILLFFAALIIGISVYQDYGMSWDEQEQRAPGLMSYNYIFNDKQDLFTTITDNHGAGFELLLVLFEKKMNITDSRDIFLMRHIVTHLFFLISAFFGYVLAYKLFKSNFLACLGFIMLVCAPRIYAHSYFNSKDLPFLSMVIITLAMYQMAFDKSRAYLHLILGLACGYMASIRIMGVLFFGVIIITYLLDLVTNSVNKQRPAKILANLLLFLLGFCFLFYISWPYLWKDTMPHFIESFLKFSHFDWGGQVLFKGIIYHGVLPWNYFPTWFLISDPELWLVAGFAGIVLVVVDIIKMPIRFISNTRERNFLVYLLGFFGPIFAVLFLHSIIYDDWRHLYFIYPSFVFIALYFIDRIIQGKYKLFIQSACLLQVVFVLFFMVRNHPFQQVYFNSFVSHDKEYLRKNFELEYWGCSYYQGLNHLLNLTPAGTIKVCCDPDGNVPLRNNIRMLKAEDRNKVIITDEDHADYFITDYRTHPQDFPYNHIEYSYVVLNSTVLCIYKLH